MEQINLNPVTGNGTGAGSESQAIPCVGVVAYVEFYPGVKGTIFCLEIVPVQGETAEDALTRTCREAYKLVDDDRDTMIKYNMNLSTVGYYIGEVDGYKVNNELVLSLDCLEVPEYEHSEEDEEDFTKQ